MEARTNHVSFEFRLAPFPYTPFSPVPLTDICHVAIKVLMAQI
jgi:hypothetical protein